MSKMPGFITRTFALPALREQPFEVGVSLDAKTLADWPRQDDAVTLIRLDQGRVIGAEALCRWRNAARGLVSPAEFIPIAERSDLIVTVDRWSIAKAVSTLAERQAGGDPIKLFVNQSSITLLDEGATVPFIARYRKEVTGGLDDTQLRNLAERLSYLREMEARRAAIIASINGRPVAHACACSTLRRMPCIETRWCSRVTSSASEMFMVTRPDA